MAIDERHKMSSDQRLAPQQLCWRCRVDELGCQTTDELEDLDEVLGQSRALESVKFGIGIRQLTLNEKSNWEVQYTRKAF